MEPQTQLVRRGYAADCLTAKAPLAGDFRSESSLALDYSPAAARQALRAVNLCRG